MVAALDARPNVGRTFSTCLSAAVNAICKGFTETGISLKPTLSGLNVNMATAAGRSTSSDTGLAPVEDGPVVAVRSKVEALVVPLATNLGEPPVREVVHKLLAKRVLGGSNSSGVMAGLSQFGYLARTPLIDSIRICSSLTICWASCMENSTRRREPSSLSMHHISIGRSLMAFADIRLPDVSRLTLDAQLSLRLVRWLDCLKNFF